MIWLWISFLAFVAAMLALDLGVFHRHAHEVSMREALVWSAVWVGLALAFDVFIYFLYEYHLWGLISPGQLGASAAPRGREAAVLFLSGYVVEESLSADNILVIALLFAYFRVKAEYQHRILFWGILGAVVLRAGMILGGLELVHRFDWVLYVFGAFLIYSAVRMVIGEKQADPAKNPFVRLARKLLPVTDDFSGARFVVRHDGRRMLTTLALVLVAVEGADAVFAVDSIPAIFAITNNPFLVFTSNIFAVLGLRSMYFAMAVVLKRFRYLELSLAVLLAVIGAEMLLKDFVETLPGKTYITLALILTILGAGVAASILRPRAKDEGR